MLKFTKAICCALTLFGALSAEANTVDKVVAVINDNIITKSDLNARFELMMRGLSKNPSREEQRLLLYRTLNSMIDEDLIQQYAADRGFTVRRADIDMAINRFEQARGLPQGSYAKLTKGLEQTAEQQIVSDLVLDQIIERDLKSRINIPNSEVDQLIRQLGASSSRTEWEISQIFIPTSEEKDGEANAKELAESAYERAKNTPDFAEVAQDYNTANSSSTDGYLGWFGEGEMLPVLEESIKSMQIGDVSKPVRSGTGYHILKLKSERTLPGIQIDPVTELQLKRTTYGDETSEDDMWVKEQDLSSALVSKIKALKVGESTGKIQQGDMEVSYTLLDTRRALPEGLEDYRERVRGRLMESRLDLAVRRMIRNLRRDAFIDVRL